MFSITKFMRKVNSNTFIDLCIILIRIWIVSFFLDLGQTQLEACKPGLQTVQGRERNADGGRSLGNNGLVFIVEDTSEGVAIGEQAILGDECLRFLLGFRADGIGFKHQSLGRRECSFEGRRAPLGFWSEKMNRAEQMDRRVFI